MAALFGDCRWQIPMRALMWWRGCCGRCYQRSCAAPGTVCRKHTHLRALHSFLLVRRYYGLATWESFRKPPTDPAHLSLAEVVAVANKAAAAAGAGAGGAAAAQHGFRFVQLPVSDKWTRAMRPTRLNSHPLRSLGTEQLLMSTLLATLPFGIACLAQAAPYACVAACLRAATVHGVRIPTEEADVRLGPSSSLGFGTVCASFRARIQPCMLAPHAPAGQRCHA